jgi:hypothetical protein
MRTLTSLLLSVLAGSGSVAAQADSALIQRAQAAYTASDWKTAAEAYATLAQRTPDQPMPHFRLGISLLNLKRPAEAKAHLETAEKLGSPLMQASYRLAQVEAAAGNKDAAFAQLARATGAGMIASNFTPTPDTDPMLASLKTDARYKDFLTAMDRNAHPCLYDPHAKEFDFWLGDWDVRPRGNPAAPPSRNTITKIHDGCVVLETYVSGGYTGQSFNMRDPSVGKWNQTWVDKAGGLHVYYGDVRDGNMYYDGEMPDPIAPTTKRIRARVTFFSFGADSLRQFSESTRDDGKTWFVNYDLIYTKRR